jgi:AcrR family transcriptional regulator
MSNKNWPRYYEGVGKTKEIPWKRPYELGKRLEQSDRKRAAILSAARRHLESSGMVELTMEALARESGVTRQTVHNLFGTKIGVLEALFDQLALNGGMERMRTVMQQSDPEAMLSGFVEVFTDFWAKDRLLIRRIHGIAAMDPEFGSAVEARNRRRLVAATRIVERLSGPSTNHEQTKKIAALWALTSFEFFDTVTESCGNTNDASGIVLDLVKRAVL